MWLFVVQIFQKTQRRSTTWQPYKLLPGSPIVSAFTIELLRRKSCQLDFLQLLSKVKNLELTQENIKFL